MSDSKKKLCFVIMPFKDELKAVYRAAIRPACKKAGFTALRVDELKGVFNINKKIIQHIFKSEVMIADLTGHNPNVFYEMGVAHAIDNKTIMIIQKDQPLPFDVSTYNCILYEPSESGLKILTDRLVTALRHLDRWRQEPTNPVQDYKPFDALVPKAELKKLRRELAEKEKQLRNAVTKAEHEKIQKELQRARSQLSEMLPKSCEEEFKKEIASLRQQLKKLQTKTVPKEKTSVFQLRSDLVENLSEEEVKKMLVERDFFDSSWNKNGKGFPNNFETLQDSQVVFDHASDLMWQQSGSSDIMTYENAKKYIEKLSQEQFAGYSDWRLPTLEEAMSLMEPEQKNGNLYIDPVFDKTQYIWTSDLYSASRAWTVDFNDGYCGHYDIGLSDYSVRAVRSP